MDKGMGMKGAAGPDQVEAAVEKNNATAREGAAGLMRGLPKEPVEAGVYDGFAHALSFAVETLSAGQAQMPVEGSGGQAVREFPPDVGLPLTAVKLTLDKLPEGEPYRFGSDMLETSEGLMEVTARLMRAAKDQKLVKASSAPAPAPPPAAPKPKQKADAKAFLPEERKFSDQHSTMTNI